ncbi:MAG: histidinol-phosphatase [Lachnospiraceae bacterium]|nr:histidinol-phosphatase [Lachnospiraceae bacterium]
MGFRYETHLHTCEGSACASASGAEMARAYKELGYTGIFVTDHFFNGNTAVPLCLPWRERIERFCLGYEHAREEGEKIGLDVFFGFEYGVRGADFLVYNLDREWLIRHKDIDRVDPRKAFFLMHQDGAFIIHAHPFRERDYIDHIELFPRDVDGVEIVNGAHLKQPETNDRAKIYAMMYGLPGTAGSDSHHLQGLARSGVELPGKVDRPIAYLEMVQAGEVRCLGYGQVLE